jgi:hypothetical protein
MPNNWSFVLKQRSDSCLIPDNNFLLEHERYFGKRAFITILFDMGATSILNLLSCVFLCESYTMPQSKSLSFL